MLTDQRYLQFLTQQLSERLEAEVVVGGSDITVWRGLGIELNNVAVREHATAPPFFFAEAIDVFLDVSSLLRAQFDFRQVIVNKPTLHVIAGVTQDAIIQRFRRLSSRQARVAPRSEGWFRPRFSLQQLTVVDGTLTYRRTSAPTPLIFSAIDGSVAYAEHQALVAQLTTSVGQQGDLGTLSFRVRTQNGNKQAPFSQQQWQGDIAATDLHVQELGHLLAHTWPQARVSFAGQYQGRWTGPLELSGRVTVGDTYLGANQITRGSLQIEKLSWPGPQDQHADRTWPSVIRTLVGQAQIEDVQGVVGNQSLPFALQHGSVRLEHNAFMLSDVKGTLGTKSQLLAAAVTATPLSGDSPTTLKGQLTARIDLAAEEKHLRSLLPPTNDQQHPLSQIDSLQGVALVRLVVNTNLSPETSMTYAGQLTLQTVALQLPTRNIAVTNVNGTVEITPMALTTTSLSGQLGTAPVIVQGKINNYQSPQRAGKLQVTFTDLADQTVASFLPGRFLLANNGTLSGEANLVIAPGKKLQTSGTVQLRAVQLDPLTFLRPFTIASGTLQWQGQNGTFTVNKGQLVDAAFTGHGSFSSLTPLRLALSLDFPTLNVAQAVAVDPPRPPAQAKTAPVIKVDLTCGECSYKSAQVTNLRASVHWHDRQADINVASARVAGGTVKGEVTVWPDLGGLFFAPHVTGIDVQSFFRVIDRPSDVLTGTATGNGKVYVEDWRRWANPAYWDAVLSLNITDGVARRVPILVRLWSALSLQSILRLQVPELPSDGLPFSTLAGDLAFGRGLAVTKNVSLDGSAVRIDTSGQIHLLTSTVDLLVQLVLLHGVTSTLEWIPLVGDLLARGTDTLTTLPFYVTGRYADPTVTPAFVGVG
jgi:hypothetical protein